MAVKILVGTSGWSYEHWRERFYPRELAKSRWLEFYSSSFNTVELNASFYHLPTEKAFTNWRSTTRDDFVFAVKVSRYITHIKKLRDCDEPIRNFLSRAGLLEGKLGPLLYQLPPNLHRNDELLEVFIDFLPQELKHVFEFRHDSWHTPEVFRLLRRYNAGFCIYDMPDYTTPVEVTADFAYIRFHGSKHMYGGCYSDEELDDWVQKLSKVAQAVNAVYVYFNNDIDGFAVTNAEALLKKLQADSA